MSTDNDDENTLAAAMGEESTEMNESSAATKPDQPRESLPDASESADEVDWVDVWEGAGVETDTRLSWTQASLAVAVADGVGISSEAAAGDLLLDAVDKSHLVGREVDGSVCELWPAPHVVEEVAD